jgi:acetylglutamate synthase
VASKDAATRAEIRRSIAESGQRQTKKLYAENLELARSGEKRCGVCRKVKNLLKDFYSAGRGRDEMDKQYLCKTCAADKSAAWRKHHLTRSREIIRESKRRCRKKPKANKEESCDEERRPDGYANGSSSNIQQCCYRLQLKFGP